MTISKLRETANEIPQGKNVRLLSQTLTVTTSSGGTLQAELSGSTMVTHGHIREVKPGEVLTGGNRGLFGPGFYPYSRIYHNRYWFSASLDINQPGQIAIRFLPFLVNGVEQSLPVINFTLDTEHRFLEALNC